MLSCSWRSVMQPLMPLDAFALLPPKKRALSISTTLRPSSSRRSVDTSPESPPPITAIACEGTAENARAGASRPPRKASSRASPSAAAAMRAIRSSCSDLKASEPASSDTGGDTAVVAAADEAQQSTSATTSRAALITRGQVKSPMDTCFQN